MTFLAETPPIPIPEASQSTSKGLKKLGTRLTGPPQSCFNFLMSQKARAAAQSSGSSTSPNKATLDSGKPN
ncbi:hypothetical protein Vadar_011981 [Vaccinium darrowii]|uniref:Uncharacterized protein n=1 Tax=Vaccinium darrowii TaxID=229202 RepID=A0ACB7XYE9_9ERIC|nr:hypothetical protein Vadar_011981 [Vaccinium darrowii]